MARAPLVLALASAASLAACSPRSTSPAPAAQAAGDPRAAAPAPGVVDAKIALALAASGARVVDVRTPEEFAEGHLPGALNVPFDQIAARASEIGPPQTPVVLYCRSGRRSGVAAETLRGLGYHRLYDAQRYDALSAAQ